MIVYEKNFGASLTKPNSR